MFVGSDPDYAIRDLYENIAEGNFPSWRFSIQVMTYEQARKFKLNPFDVTKVCITLLRQILFRFLEFVSFLFILDMART